MESTNNGQVIGIPVTSVRYAAEELQEEPASSVQDHLSKYVNSTSYGSSLFDQVKKDSAIGWMSKFSKKADSYAQGLRDHVSLAPKISETVKGKLSWGARILQAGGIEKVFRRYFSVGKREKLLKASQCYLSTTSGPIAGLLFISTHKVAFRSDRSLIFPSPQGDVRVPYKVLIPLKSIKRAGQSENVNKPSQKYIQIVTVDDFEFWFMGFVSYQRSFKYLQQVIFEFEMS
ncbi:putative GEM-like protein 8 [Iris pallida]|uniref:GEM-like protein 8 n=1 Tax=Iris pallida TaxID=29817 RepID=A0AAX6G5B3_IRIPA|nr:putative GEM-like protein 8 [Iris pallida]